ncbi:MAG: Inner membrane protein YbaL, KefB/KefC family [uncultured Thermomicrobiales bacterium]|uniref:Inner membrane protein YbaL, KefB/KefC family n=1 Tax=uncultured Thermomicrobiales bacterium TaxID=1645740 RepID=A0A6J4VD14_9BACT|nr:MAG: Inner membrane protein YbaL, KefB/KefC family [uncultured Thermomicrobiales bacterium]
MENSPLLVNLAVALLVALLGGVLAMRLGQSAMLGYILAGIAIGPFTPGFVGDPATVGALADLGVIFLMFAIGVQLSFRDLVRLGPIAGLGGLAQVALTIGLGYLVGVALGWQPLEALFFGAVLSNSSSTVLSKTLGERGDLDADHGRIALAWSSVQDLSTIVLVVLLSALAGGGDALAGVLALAIGKAIIFLALVATLGAWALPRVFEWVAALKSREIFILVTAAVALGMAHASSFFGLSLALGAFVAGIVVGESDLSHQILGEVLPLRDLFAALFFVSVGMLVNPAFVVRELPLVLLTLALIVLAKGVLVAGITALFRYQPRTVLLAGITLAQSAEFSFLLATLGASLGVVSPLVFNLLLAGAAASIIVAPPLYRLGLPLADWVQRRLPPSHLAQHPAVAGAAGAGPTGHAVICGYGRVGQVIGAALRRRGLAFVVLDEDRYLVRRARAQGLPALLGNAASPVLLERANLGAACTLVIALPDPLAARQIVEYARHHHPDLDIVARTHSWEERAALTGRGVTEAVMGELELALEMMRHTLGRFGLSDLEALAEVDRARTQTVPAPSPKADLQIMPAPPVVAAPSRPDSETAT